MIRSGSTGPGSSQGRLLVVSFTDRDDRIRIISAGRMTRRERRTYEREKRRSTS
ncbi:MAG TPA: BrnT family toxin [Gammaproteobacteria bacterium]